MELAPVVGAATMCWPLTCTFLYLDTYRIDLSQSIPNMYLRDVLVSRQDCYTDHTLS